MSNINTILIKRRTTGEAGAPASLSGGELAFNEVNSVLYYGSNNGVIPIGGTGEFATNTLVGSISADLSSQIGTLDLRVTDEVATLNTTIQSVSSTLDAKIDAQIAAVIDFAPDALNTLNELASALGDDENFASNLVSTLGNVNSTIASVSSTLDSKIDSEVSTLNSTVQSVSASLESAISSLNSDSTSQITSLSAELKGDISTEVAALEASISSLNTYVDTNFLNLTGGNISGDLAVSGSIAATGGLEISTGGGSTSLFVGSNVVGINTEAPTEALEVVGNGKFSGTVEVATPSLSGHAANKGYVDTAIANLVDGAPALLDTLNELAAAINDDESFAATIATNIGNVSTALASVSATLDSKIDTQISSLSSTVDANFVEKTESDAVTLNGGLTVASGLTVDNIVATGTTSLDNGIIVTDGFGNITFDGNVTVTNVGTISLGSAVTINNGGSGTTSLDAGAITTDGYGAASFTGEVTVAEPTQSASAATKNYVDVAISILDGGTF